MVGGVSLDFAYPSGAKWMSSSKQAAGKSAFAATLAFAGMVKVRAAGSDEDVDRPGLWR